MSAVNLFVHSKNLLLCTTVLCNYSVLLYLLQQYIVLYQYRMLSLLSTTIGHKEDRIWHVCWSHCGKYFATCSEDKTIKIWSIQNNNSNSNTIICITTLEDAHTRTIRSCEFSPDDELIASASFDGTVIIWENNSKTKCSNFDEIASLEGHENEVKSVAWNAHGNFLATCGRDKRIWIWERLNEVEFECVCVLEGHTQDVKYVKWHSTKNILYSCSYDDSIKVWHEYNDDWYCHETLLGHSSTVWGITCMSTNNTEYLCSCSADCSIILWKHVDLGLEENVASENKTDTYVNYLKVGGLHAHPILSVDSHSSLPYVATGGEDNAIVVTQLSGLTSSPDSSCICKVTDAHTTDVNCVRYCKMCTGIDYLQYIDEIFFKFILTSLHILWHCSSVLYCRWNPTQPELLVSVSDDGTIKVWKLEI